MEDEVFSVDWVEDDAFPSTAAAAAVGVALEEEDAATVLDADADALLDLTLQREEFDLRLSFFGLTTFTFWLKFEPAGSAAGTGSGMALRAAKAW